MLSVKRPLLVAVGITSLVVAGGCSSSSGATTHVDASGDASPESDSAVDAGKKPDAKPSRDATADAPTKKHDAGSDATPPDGAEPDDATADATIDVTTVADAPVEASEAAGGEAGSDAADAANEEGGPYPAVKGIFPKVVNSGGPILAKPIFVPVLFAGDSYESQLETFVAAIGPSAYWTATTAEYGVGAAEVATPIVLDETFPATMDDDQLQTWLANRLGTDPRFGALPGSTVFDGGAFDAGSVDALAPYGDADSPQAAPPAGAIYALFLPAGTTLSHDGVDSCTTFLGYHNSFNDPASGTRVVYAAVARCATFGQHDVIDNLTVTMSQLLAEAATDPILNEGPSQLAYGSVDEDHAYWSVFLGGGEIGSLCADLPDTTFHPDEAALSPFAVQRTWSNQAAAGGHDPCVPHLALTAEPAYFNVAPNVGEVSTTLNGQAIQTLAVSAPVNQPTQVELDFFSDATTDGQAWMLQVFDANHYINGGVQDLSFDQNILHGDNGTKVELTITNRGTDGLAARPYLLQSTIGDYQTWWIGVVTN